MIETFGFAFQPQNRLFFCWRGLFVEESLETPEEDAFLTFGGSCLTGQVNSKKA